jgi:uncharacterized glyoxalase superfamily protein PhnB
MNDVDVIDTPHACHRPMPAGVVIPVLHYPDLRAAVNWLGAVFGFEEQLRIGHHRSQLRLGHGVVLAAQSDPPQLAGVSGTHAVFVRIEQVDAHHARARAAGARIASPPADYACGERQYTTVDPGGHVWIFSQPLADAVTVAESRDEVSCAPPWPLHSRPSRGWPRSS